MRSLFILALVFGVGCVSPAPAEDGSTLERLESLGVPPHLATAIPSPDRNPLTPDGIELGRRLFYDPLLSGDDSISCATCHQQARAFSDGAQISSDGLSGAPLKRHTPALINLAFMPAYFWDGGGYDLESVAFGPIGHPDEMGQSLDRLVDELASAPLYPALFSAAFSDGLTLPNIVRALAQFQRSLVSADAPYDRFVAGDADALGPAALAGMALVARHCGDCHPAPFFTDFGYANNGLDQTYADDHERLAWGRGRLTETPEDKGAYKVPTLRNAAVTAPYMHDGRFSTLRAVFDHYRFELKYGAGLDPRLRHKAPISDREVGQMMAFLDALTDARFLTDPRWGPPP